MDIQNFEVIDAKTFSINREVYPRSCFIHIKSDGNLSIINMINNSVIIDNISVFNILINNKEVSDLETLRRLIFNRICQCAEISKSNNVFDQTFDETFE